MPLKELFLSYQHDSADEIANLATELQVRGVVPWVDKLRGGFRVARESPVEARRVIREDCFGFLLYATEEAFESEFIREVEVDEAKRARADDASYLLFAFGRDMGFKNLSCKSLNAFGIDLGAYHSVSVGTRDAPTETVVTKQIEIARLVLDEVIARSLVSDCPSISMQISTRDLFPDEDSDALRVNATHLGTAVGESAQWVQLLGGLVDIKDRIARAGARPRLHIHGSKHLTTAFMVGRVFSPFELDIRQSKRAVWRTDAPPSYSTTPLAVRSEGVASDGALFVGVASRNKDIAIGMDEFIEKQGVEVPKRVLLAPRGDPLDVDEQLCRAMVIQTYATIELAMRGHRFSSIHLFVAAPQAFMMMLGREFRGMPPVHLYEWTGTEYIRSCVIPGAVL